MKSNVGVSGADGAHSCRRARMISTMSVDVLMLVCGRHLASFILTSVSPNGERLGSDRVGHVLWRGKHDEQ